MVAILSSIISAAAAMSVCLINNHYQRKRDEKSRKDKQEKEQADIKAEITMCLEDFKDTQNDFNNQIHAEIKMVEYQLSELAKHVDKHNQVIERTYELEKRTELQEEKIKVANDRIKDLEKAVGQ